MRTTLGILTLFLLTGGIGYVVGTTWPHPPPVESAWTLFLVLLLALGLFVSLCLGIFLSAI